jgi:hypothetical protein
MTSKLQSTSSFSVERYAVTSGLATVGGVEQPESINNVFVDGVFGHLIVGVIETETSVCRRERSRGQCAVFLGNDQSSGEHAQYESKDAYFQMTGDTPRSFVWMLRPDAR